MTHPRVRADHLPPSRGLSVRLGQHSQENMCDSRAFTITAELGILYYFRLSFKKLGSKREEK